MPLSTILARLVLVLSVPAVVSLSAQESEFTTAIETDPDAAQFVYDDIRTFVRAHAMLAGRPDTVEILRTEYLAKGTRGLKMFIEKYDLRPERLARAIARYPEDYAALGDMPERLQKQEAMIRKAFTVLKQYIPHVVFPPTYYLVDVRRGIGSGSLEGQLITVEKEASKGSKDHDETALLVHELTHFQQGRAIGYMKYAALFGGEKSLLGLTIREGTAEFFSKLAAGRYTQNEAEEFVLNNEKRLWREFQPVMLGRETGDWMWNKPKDPDQPYHVAYVMGARIVSAYYEKAHDKGQAVRDILSVVDFEKFLDESGYGLLMERKND